MDNKIMLFLFFWHQVTAFDNNFYQTRDESMLRISPAQIIKNTT